MSYWDDIKPGKIKKPFYAKKEVEFLEKQLKELGFNITAYLIPGGTYWVQKNGKTICEGSSKEVCYFMEGIKQGMNHG